MPNLDYYNTTRMHQMVNSFQDSSLFRPICCFEGTEFFHLTGFVRFRSKLGLQK